LRSTARGRSGTTLARGHRRQLASIDGRLRHRRNLALLDLVRRQRERLPSLRPERGDRDVLERALYGVPGIPADERGPLVRAAKLLLGEAGDPTPPADPRPAVVQQRPGAHLVSELAGRDGSARPLRAPLRSRTEPDARACADDLALAEGLSL